MKKAVISQGAYKVVAGTNAERIQDASERLADIARNLTVAADFSPCTIDAMRKALSDIPALQAALKGMVEVSVQRGCTHFDEQKEKLLEGNLRLNRRAELDQAAE